MKMLMNFNIKDLAKLYKNLYEDKYKEMINYDFIEQETISVISMVVSDFIESEYLKQIRLKYDENKRTVTLDEKYVTVHYQKEFIKTLKIKKINFCNRFIHHSNWEKIKSQKCCCYCPFKKINLDIKSNSRLYYNLNSTCSIEKDSQYCDTTDNYNRQGTIQIIKLIKYIEKLNELVKYINLKNV